MAKKDIFSKLWKQSMHKLTGGLGNDTSHIKPLIKEDIHHILIIRPNHRLGNMLLATPFVKEVHSLFPSAQIDLFVKGNAANLIFENYPNIEQVYHLPRKGLEQLPRYFATWFRMKKKKYDLVLNVYPRSSSGKIATKVARARHKFFGNEFTEELSTREEAYHIALWPVFALRKYLQLSGLSLADAPVPLLELKLSPDEKQRGKTLLHKITGNEGKTICLFTFATGDKCLPVSWWKPFYHALKEKAEEYTLIEILNYEKISQIEGEAPTLYSQNIREMAAVMAAADLFIGTDSGVMHLAAASSIPTVGIFSVTDGKKFGPYGKKNRAVQVTENDYTPVLKAIEPLL